MSTSTIIIKDIYNFNLVQTIESGQCFRWEKVDEARYQGTAYHRTITIGQINNDLYIDGTTPKEFQYIWLPYFDLEGNYEHIIEFLSIDPLLKKAMKGASGLHVLKQEPFETLISYIISANNHIPRIKKIIKILSETLGDEIILDEQTTYAFPTEKQLALASIDDVNKCKAGFRNKYIHKTAKSIYEKNYDFIKLKDMSYEKAKNNLKQFLGVGDKVADCALLFSGIRLDAFPVDVWIKRVIEREYGKNDMSLTDIAQFGRVQFGKYAGYANNYLFNYIRNTD
ncbi:MAG: 8-oxoguanine DNA glycosylase [Clostridiales bacterium]|nr:8-oxoguanine DNA glycosylase [Clostridiales bacterium]